MAHAPHPTQPMNSIVLEFEDADPLRQALEYIGESDAPIVPVRGTAVVDGRAFDLWDDFDAAMKES